MNKSVIFALLVLLFPLLVLNNSAAQIDIVTYSTTNAFSMASNTASLSLCQCQVVTDALTVVNTGVYASRYTLAHNLPGIVRAYEYSFDLLPGEQRMIPITLSAACDARVNDILSYSITDVFGTTQVIEKPIFIGKCQNLAASLITSVNESIGPCEPVDYSLWITNTGVVSETYEVEFGGKRFEEYIDQPYQTVVIPAGLSTSVNATLTIPCELSGTFSLPFGAKAVQNNLVATMTHQLVVRPDYGFSVSLQAEEVVSLDVDIQGANNSILVCAQDTNIIPLIITNNASIQNTYNFSLLGPEFLSLISDPILTLNAGESAVIELMTRAPAQSAGVYEYTLTAISKYGAFKNVLTSNLDVQNCHEVLTTIVAQSDVHSCSGTYEFPVTVENTGLVGHDVIVSVSGADYATLSDEEFFLAAQEQRELTLALSVPYVSDEQADIVVSSSIQGLQDVHSEDSLRFDVLNVFSCSQVVLADEPRARYDSTDAIVKLTNTGRVAREYQVEVVGNDWFALDPEYEYITISPGQVVKVGLNTYQTDVQGSEHSATLQLTADNGEVYEVPFTLTMYAKNVFVLTYEYFVAHPCQLASLLLLLALVVLIIFSSKKKGVFVWRSNAFLVLLLLIVVSIIIVLSIKPVLPLYDPLPEPTDSLEFVMRQGAVLTVDVNPYFEDPDGDVLVFSMSDMDNVSVRQDEVVGGLFTFIPDKDWFGERRFSVTADDGLDSTRSPRMNFVVVERPAYSFVELYTKYCQVVNLSLFILFLVVLFVLVSKRKKKKQPKTLVEPLLATKSEQAVNKRASKTSAKKKVASQKKKVVVKKKSAKKKSTQESTQE